MLLNRILFTTYNWGTKFLPNRTFSVTHVKSSGGHHGPVWATYRNCHPPVTKGGRVILGRLFGITAWSQVIYLAWYDTGVMFGHDFLPDLSKFTDEELGIPPDDVDLEGDENFI